MYKTLRVIFDWSEVWALLIPILYLLVKRNQPRYLRPVIAYLFLALLLNLFGNVIADFKAYLPAWMQSNNPIYNIHSIIRFICFSSFFVVLNQNAFTQIKKALPILSLVILLVNFTMLEKFDNFNYLSGNLLAAEAYLLLIYCMLYYLAKLRTDADELASGPDFWIVTGLSIYVVINFFVFLFYVPMITQNSVLADNIWDVHNIAYILLCIFITKAFYESARHQLTI